MRETAPDDFAESVDYDERIRKVYRDRTDKAVWLHSSRKPIAEVAKDTGQISMDLDDGIYCAGGCGL